MQDEIYDIFDRSGRKIGRATWTEAHTKGLIHQTSAILVFRDRTKQELLIQKRSKRMFHSPGLWMHSAGGHVLAGTSVREGARQELQEELFFGQRAPEVPMRFVTQYLHHDLPHNYERLHVFEMVYPGPFSRGPKEVSRLKWVNVNELRADMKQHPEIYAPAFHLVFTRYLAAKRQKKRKRE